MIHNIDPPLSQWNVGRSVMVSDTDATHILFANKGDSRGPKVEIVGGEAKIPDYLLQTGKILVAYLMRNGVTLESKSFPVVNQPKPDDYVYTETEIRIWEELEERITALEENGGSGTTSIPRLIVQITEDEEGNYISSHTSQEIYDYWQNGGEVAVDFDYMDKFIPIRFDAARICFYRFGEHPYDIEEICIGYDGENNYVRRKYSDYATKADITKLEDSVGDIETALDSIIAIQNELIGGNS